jgi:uncharacterized membrane protein
MNWFLIATVSALFSAAAAVAQKKVLFRLDAFEFSFFVSAAILTISLPAVFIADVSALSPDSIMILTVKSILGGFAFLLVMISLQKNQISSALPLLGTTPAITALLAVPLIGDSIAGVEWIGIGLMTFGTYLLEKRGKRNIPGSMAEFFRSKNHYYIFGAVALFAVSSIADKILLSVRNVDPFVVLFYQHIIYCLMFGAFVAVRTRKITEVRKIGKKYLALIIIIALLTVAYRFTQLMAVRLAPVALVLAVKRTSILYASFFGGKLFSEERLAHKIAGAVLIVAAGFIILRNVG